MKRCSSKAAEFAPFERALSEYVTIEDARTLVGKSNNSRHSLLLTRVHHIAMEYLHEWDESSLEPPELQPTTLFTRSLLSYSRKFLDVRTLPHPPSTAPKLKALHPAAVRRNNVPRRLVQSEVHIHPVPARAAGRLGHEDHAFLPANDVQAVVPPRVPRGKGLARGPDDALRGRARCAAPHCRPGLGT